MISLPEGQAFNRDRSSKPTTTGAKVPVPLNSNHAIIIQKKGELTLAAIITFIYIAITLISLFFAGPYAPLVGLAIGFPIHMLILLTKIYNKLKEIDRKLEQ